MSSPAAAAVTVLWCGAAVIWAVFGIWQVCALALAIHVVELPLAGIRVGRRAGVGLPRTVVMTLLFGAVWWLPLARATARVDRRGDSGDAEHRDAAVERGRDGLKPRRDIPE